MIKSKGSNQGVEMRYFAYGSNLDEKQMKERCPGAILIGRACLPGYRMEFSCYSQWWGGGVADIIRDEKSQVWGLLYDLSENDWKNLDDYEGYPELYTRAPITVINEYLAAEKVAAYSVVNKQPFIPPSYRYLKIIKEAARDHAFPETYQQFLRNLEELCYA